MQIAESMFPQLRARECLRRQMVAPTLLGKFISAGNDAAAWAEVENGRRAPLVLPRWRGVCALDGVEIDMGPNAVLPTIGHLQVMCQGYQDQWSASVVHMTLIVQHARAPAHQPVAVDCQKPLLFLY